MDNRTRITNRTVEEVIAGEKEFVIWDTTVSGFGLRIRPTGGKSWIFTYRSAGGRAGKVQRITIGNAQKLRADPAREEAKRLAALHHAGVDTAKDRSAEKEGLRRERDAPTVSALLDRFIEDHAKVNLKQKTWTEYERLVDKVLKPEIGDIKLADLGTRDVSEMHHRLREKPTQAALAVRVLSSAISCGVEWGLREAGSNPAKIRLKGTRRRERLFSDREVVKLKATINEHERDGKMTSAVALGLRLLFETGCRAGEICSLRWEDVDFAENTLRWEDTKTGRTEKAITIEAKRLLLSVANDDKEVFVCPSPAKKKLRVETLEAGFERVLKAAGVPAKENASLHLIRHWFSTKIYTDPKIPLPLAMKLVGHRSVATAMRYCHLSNGDLQRATLAAEKTRKAALRVAEKEGRVVRFPAAK